MGRVISFRGKHIHIVPGNTKFNGSWIYGYYAGEGYIVSYGDEVLIDKESLGEYSGLRDKNNIEIYEGDIIKTDLDNKLGVIVFAEGSFRVKTKRVTVGLNWLLDLTKVEVIGNIYDNPELLEESEE